MKKVLFVILAMSATLIADAQCRTFVKNNCGEAMGDYVPAENFNAAKLLAGDEAEMNLTFYAGEDYRILVCTHDILGDVQFKLIDEEGETLYDNSQNGFDPKFDFSVEGTRKLKIDINVPPSESRIRPQGCVAIMVGRLVDVN
ncbi:MAG TPA: hypothetical protein VKY29_00155 [Cryomorphaceae bacterium]|nr:hypothetical protein [Cryomorphaceae bacterium]